MRIKNLDLVVALCFVAINIGWTQIPNRPIALGIFFVLPLTFILPGYTLTEILFRGSSLYRSRASSQESIQHPNLKQGQPIGVTDQIALSLGLSLAIDVLVGFGLNLLPVGLQASSWALALGLLTTLFVLLLAFLRRSNIVKGTKIPRLRVTTYDYILFGLAIFVITTTVWLSIIRPTIPQSGFTQLWMLPVNQANKSCAVSIGVQSFESTSTTYRIIMTVNGSEMDAWSSINLDPQREWVLSVPITPGSNKSIFIEARLYRADKPDTIYRDVHLTFLVLTGGKNSQTQQCSTATSSSG